MKRVAVLADYLEEKWPSMDLVAEELGGKVKSEKRKVEGEWGENEFGIELIRPAMRRRFSKSNLGKGYTADRLLNRLWDYPQFLKVQRDRFDLFHLADHSYSQVLHVLPPERCVVTCHDVDTFRCLWEPGHSGRNRFFLAMTRRILSGLQRAAHIACDSRATQEELITHQVVPLEKTSVVPLGLREGLLEPASRQTAQRIDELLGGHPTDRIVLLHVGSTIARKRIDVLLEVFARVHQKNPRVRLLRVGGRFNEAQLAQVEKLGISHAILVLPFLSVPELGEIYRRATLGLLPSDAEGFGLPVIEAMACGTPILISDLPVLREVGGEAAEYAPVAEIEGWAKQIERLLEEKTRFPMLWEARREACQRQGQQFTWAETRRKMGEIYREVLTKAEYRGKKSRR